MHKNLNLGRTKEYTTHALLLVFTGLFALKIFWGLSVVLLLLAFIFFRCHFGIELNSRKNEVRLYYKFTGIKTGKWKRISPSDSYSIVSKQERTSYSSRVNSNTYITSTFSIHAVKDGGEKELLFEFEDEQTAKNVTSWLKMHA